MLDFLKSFDFKRGCFICFITLEALIRNSKSYSIVENLDIDNHIRNERFEDLISEILIGEAPVHDYLIHYEAASSNFIDGIIRKTNAKKKMIIKSKNVIITVNSSHPATTVMINYDKKNDLKLIVSFKRFTIHIISLKKPVDFNDFYSVYIRPSDVIIFICQKYYGTCDGVFDNDSNISALDPLFLKNTKFLAKVLLTIIIEVLDNRVRLYEICFYCGTAAKLLIQKHEIDLSTEMSFNDIDLYSKMIKNFEYKSWNFNSHTFKVGFPNNGLNFGCRNPKETGTSKHDEFVVSCDAIHNLEGMMLLEIQKRLNFTVKLSTFRFVTVGDVTEKMLNVTGERRADWTVGSISVTSSRTSKVDFSFPVSEDPVKVIYSAERGFMKDGLRIVNVFSIRIWTLIAFTLIVQSAVVYITNRKAGQNQRKIGDIVWALGFMLTEQSLKINWTSLGGRVSISWVLCCICISTLLKAQLTSFITKPPIDPLAKFDELVSGGFQLNLISAQTKFISEMLNSSSDQSLHEMSNRVKPRSDMCLTFKDMIGKKEMLIEELGIIYNELNGRCRKHLTSEDILSLRVTCDVIVPSIHAWAFPKRAPYLYFINKQIMLYHQHGLQKKWSEALRVPPGNQSVYFDGVSVVDRSRLSPKKIKGFGHLFLWFVGIGLSLLCFITEIVLNKLRKKDKREWNAIKVNI